MTIEIALLISIVSVMFGVYQGISNLKRNHKVDTKSDATELTTVIVKLENIGNGVTEIKSEMSNLKDDLKEVSEKAIRAEESSASAHRRIDEIINRVGAI